MSVALSIVVPAYNEAERIAPTLLALAQTKAEIVVVDDGSTDDTVAVCEGLGVRVIQTSPNRGKGHAVRAGMLAARGRIRVMADADGSTPASELPRLLAALRNADIAIGSRRAPGAVAPSQPRWRQAWSRLCNAVIQRTLVPGVKDTQCGFKAFSAAAAIDLFGRATIDGWAFDLEILALAARRDWRVVEVGVAWHDDRRSRVRPLQDFGKALREAVTIRRNLAIGVYS